MLTEEWTCNVIPLIGKSVEVLYKRVALSPKCISPYLLVPACQCLTKSHYFPFLAVYTIQSMAPHVSLELREGMVVETTSV